MQLLRSIATIVLSLFAGGLAIGLIEAGGHALLASDGTAPSAAGYAVAVFAWGIGSALGIHLVARLNPVRRGTHVAITCCLFVAVTLVNLLSLPHPGWVFPAAALAIGAGCLAGVRTAPAAAAA